MAELAVMVGMPPEDMPPAMGRVDTQGSVLTEDMLNILPGQRVDMRAMQAAHVIGMAVATGEAVIGTVAVTGEAITGIRPMDILDWAMAIHTTGLAITVTATVDTMARTPDTILIATATGRP